MQRPRCRIVPEHYAQSFPPHPSVSQNVSHELEKWSAAAAAAAAVGVYPRDRVMAVVLAIHGVDDIEGVGGVVAASNEMVLFRVRCLFSTVAWGQQTTAIVMCT
jgi:hypothetical protein